MAPVSYLFIMYMKSIPLYMKPRFIQDIGFEAIGISINTEINIHALHTFSPVSYTHLTLPTKLEV